MYMYICVLCNYIYIYLLMRFVVSVPAVVCVQVAEGLVCWTPSSHTSWYASMTDCRDTSQPTADSIHYFTVHVYIHIHVPTHHY